MRIKSRLGSTCLFLAISIQVFPGIVAAQSPKASSSDASPRLSEQEIRGEGLFLQRCSLCHLPKVVKPFKSFGPSLTGVLKGASPAKEKTVRLFISTGVPAKMPGFQSALKPDQFDDLIAYLKTL